MRYLLFEIEIQEITLAVWLYYKTVGYRRSFNSLPNKNFLDRKKFKAFTNDKLDVAKIMISVFHMVENIAG